MKRKKENTEETVLGLFTDFEDIKLSRSKRVQREAKSKRQFKKRSW